MKKLNKSILALTCAAAFTSAMVNADSFQVGFNTIQAVEIFEEQSLSFGPVLTLGSGDTCELVVGSGTAEVYEGNGAVGHAIQDGSGLAAGSALPIYFTGCAGVAAADAAEAAAGSLTGTPAAIRITAAAGTSVDVTIQGGDDATGAVTLELDGYVVDHNGGAARDPITEASVTTPVTVQVPATSDASANVTPGQTWLIIGGEIENNTDLSPDTAYNVDYTVTVDY